MNFLAPLFLLGIAAIALPIVFHLIRRTSRERTIFSSLMFLLPSPPRVTRRSRLENIVLLVLRCMVFVLLAAGFARPYLFNPKVNASQAGPAKMVAILLDTSASMRRQELWPEAQKRAREMIKDLNTSDQAAIFAFDEQLRPIFTFQEWNGAQPGERVELGSARITSVAPTWAGTHLGNALLSAQQALEDAARDLAQGKELSQRIVVISDLQSGVNLAGLQGHEWPKGVGVELVPVKARSKSNAGIHLLAEREENASASNQAPWRIRIVNASDSKKEQFKVMPRQARGFGSAVESYIPPGQSRILAPPDMGTAPSGEMILTGDDEDFDNRLYWARTPAEKVRIPYLGNEPENDPSQPLYYLKRAFGPTGLRQIEIVQSDTAVGIAAEKSDKAALLVVADELKEPALKSVREQLENGRTVLIVMKTPASAASIAALTVGRAASDEAAVANYALLGEIDFSHPLFKPFADPRFSDFTKIHFWKYRRLQTDGIPGARVIAHFDSGDPALLQASVGRGTLFVLTTSWHPTDSQLALSSKFVPLLYSFLEISGGTRTARLQYVIGDSVSFPSEWEGTATVRKPDGTEVPWAKNTAFAQTDVPGLYTARSDAHTLTFAVNLSPSESNTAPLTLEELEQLGVPLKNAPGESRVELARKARQVQAAEMENQQKLWRWMIVGALLFVLIETWLAGRLSRVAPAQA